MTDLAFYADLGDLAEELLTDFGGPATLRTVTLAAPDAQGRAAKTVADAPGLAVRTASERVLRLFERTATATFVVKVGGAEPRPGAELLTAGERWQVDEVKLVKPLTQLLVAFVACTQL